MIDPRAVPALTSHLGYWLRFVSNHVSHAFARRLDTEGVTVAEWAVLRGLYDRDAVNPSRLAAEMGLTRGAISKLADRLVAKRLVAREDHEEDGRSHGLALTPAGRSLVPTLAAEADANDAEFFGGLSQSERSMIEGALRSIVEQRRLKSIPLS